MIGVEEKVDIRDGIACGIRSDGRSRKQLREFTVETGVSPHSCGSSIVKLEETSVMATLSYEIVECEEEKGAFEIHVDSSTTCMPGVQADARLQYNAGVGQQMSRLLGLTPTVIGAKSLIPLKELFIGEGQCFSVKLDIQVLSVGGGAVEGCAALATRAAVANFTLPHVNVVGATGGEGVSIEVDPSKTMNPLDGATLPLLLTFGVASSYVVSDPSAVEEQASTSSVHVGVVEGDVCFLKSSQCIAASDLPTIMHDAIVAASEWERQLQEKLSS